MLPYSFNVIKKELLGTKRLMSMLNKCYMAHLSQDVASLSGFNSKYSEVYTHTLSAAIVFKIVLNLFFLELMSRLVQTQLNRWSRLY